MKLKTLEDRIAFLKEAAKLLEGERAVLETRDEAERTRLSKEVKDAAKQLYGDFAPVLRGMPEERYLDDFVRNYMPQEVLSGDLLIEDLGLSMRTCYVLLNAGLTYLGEVREKGEAGLLRIRWFGRKGLNEVKEILSEKGLPLDGKKYVTLEQRAQVKKLDMTIYDFAKRYTLSPRTYHCLRKDANIQYVGQLVTKTESDLLRTKNFGRKSMEEVKNALSHEGLYLGMIKEYTPSPITPQDIEKILDMTTEELSLKYALSVRTENVLLNIELGKLRRTMYVGDIVQRTERDWLRERNFGRKSLNELKSALAFEGLYLGMPEARNYQPPEQLPKTE